MEQGILIQARTGSSRLPNKIVLPFYGDKSILDLIIEKLIVFEEDYRIILCTTTSKKDDVMELFAQKFGISIFRGSENNVLKRFVEASNHYKIKNIVRVCADNPFLDVEGIKALMTKFKEGIDVDYCSYKNKFGVPIIKTHIGLYAELVSTNSLNRALQQTNNELYLEHVTNYVYGNPNKFKVELYPISDEKLNNENLRFTVDDQLDFDNLSKLYEKHIYFDMDISKTVDYVLSTPNLLNSMKSNINKYNK